MRKLNQFIITVLFVLNLGFLNSIAAQDWMEITRKALAPNQEKDSTYFFLEKAYEKAVSDKNIGRQFFTLKLFITKSNDLYDLKIMKNYIDRYSKELKKQDSTTLKRHYFNLKYENYFGYYRNTGEFDKALVYIDSLESRLAKTPISERTFFYYQTLNVSLLYKAEILKSQGHYEQAIQFLLKKIKENEDDKENIIQNEEFKYTYLRQLSDVYSDLGYYSKSIEIDENLLELSKNWRNYNSSKIYISINLAESNLKIGNLIKAEAILQGIPDKEKFNAVQKNNYNRLRVKLFLAKNENEKAINLSNALITNMLGLRGDAVHNDVIQQKINKAQILEQLNLTKEANKLYNTIYEDLIRDTKVRDPYYNKRHIITSIHGILKTEFNTIISNKNKTRALITKLLLSLEQLQLLYNTEQDKQFLIEKTYPALQLAFDIVYQINEKEEDPKLVALAFLISEKSKSIALRESHIDVQSDQIKDIPDRIFEQEKILRSNIRHYNNKIGEDYLDRQSLDSLYVALDRFSSFQKLLENNYPKYYNFKYSNRVLSLADVQKKMDNGKVVLSYFKSTTALYGIGIEKDNYFFKQIAWTKEDEIMVKAFTKDAAKNNFDGTIASQLYIKLLKPLFPNKLPNRLLIIPDGALNYLNFELLKAQKKWMLYSTAVSYDESVTLSFAFNPMNPDYNTKFVGFAPFYAKSDTLTEHATLAPLFFSKQEIKTTAEYYDGDYFTGEEGSLARFRESVINKKSKSNNIYHIASHAKVNENEPGKSYILFNNGETEKLLAEDIFTLDMQGGFVVLSACETGIGALKTGQGMRSFSQAFRYAGASTLLHSKWKVSDRSTALIMEQFYANLTQGVTKDIALQKAKINYINNVEDKALAAPYYWAAFVLAGDVESVPINSFPLWKLGLFTLLIILFSVGLICFLKRAYHKAATK